MEKKVLVKSVGTYNGHSIQANGIVVLNMVMDYSELVNVVQMFQLLNEDIKIKVKYASEQPMNLGSFRLDNVSVGSDGVSKVKFKGSVDFIETDNLNSMALNGRDELFNVRLVSYIDILDSVEADGGIENIQF